MDLHARAIHLKLQGRLAQLVHRVRNSPGRLREHRLQRPKQLDVIPSQIARFKRRPGNAADVAGQHYGAPDPFRSDSGRLRHGIQHHALERALPQLARDQPGKEALFRLGGAHK